MNKLTKKLQRLAGIIPTTEVSFKFLGLISSNKPGTLSYLADEEYSRILILNSNIEYVLTSKELAPVVIENNRLAIICDDPVFSFFTLHNYLMKQNRSLKKTSISSSAQIHSSAVIAQYDVEIGKNVVIEPLVTVMSGTRIKDNCIIRAGTTLGTEGFEQKFTSRGVISVIHDALLILEKNVEIGANNAMVKGLFGINTLIGENTKTDNLVHIAHSAQIGKRCLITAGVTIAGSVISGDDVWFGPGAVISNGIKIGNKARISLGSVVTKDVPSAAIVSGNFAIDHQRFMENLKESLT